MFNDASVRATLLGMKRSFRRPINPQPELCHGCQTCQFRCDHFLGRIDELVEVGQVLWVKESWLPPPTDPHWHFGAISTGPKALYRADYSAGSEEHEGMPHWKYKAMAWGSAKSMARDYARLELQVTDYRVERLDAISEEQALGEGIPLACQSAYELGLIDDPDLWPNTSAQGCFAFAWDRIMAAAGYGWEANPFVHVVEFKVLTCPTELPHTI